MAPRLYIAGGQQCRRLARYHRHLTGSGTGIVQPHGSCTSATVAATFVMEGPLEAAPLDHWGELCDHSWVNQLTPDPETQDHAPNKRSRQVKSGHYVLVQPTPLPSPSLVAHSPEMAASLGLGEEEVQSEQFLRLFSGNPDAVPGFTGWATPYALSIYGQEMYQNCPFGNGNGYGDGRAISLGEVVVPPDAAAGSGVRWELQLKGGGTTPFCRGGDGRAVLRSSVREFLASEAMHALGVPTTRALSLVVSDSETSKRPWYSNEGQGPEVPDIDDPRLAHIPIDMRHQLLAQFAQQTQSPDIMQTERCAITCRVATSFLRIGHVELHGRRARKGDDTAQLEAIVRHALAREYAELLPPGEDAMTTEPLQPLVLRMLEECQRRIAELTAGWVRVGFCQGNFNSDNCLIGGRTMDYGPFGFIERFQPLWNMWSGGGEHFGFLNQPTAGMKNFESLAIAVTPLLDAEGQSQARQIVAQSKRVASAALDDVWRRKLGLLEWATRSNADGGGAALWGRLRELLETGPTDFTIFWRQLAVLAEAAPPAAGGDAAWLEPLRSAFHKELCDGAQSKWAEWLRDWRTELTVQRGEGGGPAAAADMRLTSPKYILREAMLVGAYTQANHGDYSAVHELLTMLKRPYDEQPEFEAKYYVKTPLSAAQLGGTGYMS